MQLNTNLVKVLTDLAAAAEKGGINVDININVNVASNPATEAPSDSKPVSDTPEGFVPDGGVEPMIGPAESEQELEELLQSRPGSEESTEEKDTDASVAVPSANASVSTENASTEPKASKTVRPRSRPMGPGAPAAGSNGRCVKMVKQRQDRLSQMGVNVPEELMVVPASEVEAKELLTKLRPYMAS